MKLYITKVENMRPTQVTVGFIEVQIKKNKLSSMNDIALKKYLKSNPIPAVIGPGSKMYLTDKHHMGRALTELKIEKCYFKVEYNLTDIPENKFFQVLEVLELIHPYNEFGSKVDFSKIPLKLQDLIDDPYRSLASEVKRAHGFIKIPKPYIEFEWADFLRSYISIKEIQTDMKSAVDKSLIMCHSAKAKHMPGYIHQSFKMKKI